MLRVLLLYRYNNFLGIMLSMDSVFITSLSSVLPLDVPT